MIDPVASVMDTYVNKHISKICPCSFHADSENHCTHFVCHVMEYRFGWTCFDSSGKGSKDDAANIRVHEVFSRCRRVGKWVDRPADLKKCFIFITKASNVNLTNKTMINVPRKHIGIFIEGDVWQYKNRVKHVIKQTPADFATHYDYDNHGKGYATFFGEFPL